MRELGEGRAMLVLLFAVAPFVPEPLPDGAFARLGALNRPPRASTYALAYSPDGKWLAWAGDAVADCGLLVINPRTGGRHPRWDDRQEAKYVPSICFDQRGHLFWSGGGVRMWDLTTGRHVRRFDAGWLLPAATNGRWVAALYNDTISVFETATGRTISTIPGRPRTRHLAVHPDPRRNELAYTNGEGELFVWDVGAGKLKWRVAGHGRGGRGVVPAYDPRGRYLATAGPEGVIRLWSPDGTPGPVLSLGDGRPRSLAFGPRGLLAAGFEDATVRVYDTDTRKELRRWPVPGGASSIAFAPDGSEVAVGSSDSAVTRWDPRTGQPLDPIAGHVGPITELRFRPDGRLLSVGRDQTVIEWDARTKVGRKTLVQVGEEFNPVRALAPDASRLVVLPTTGGSRGVVFWGPGWKESCRLSLPGESLGSAAFSPDGRRVAAHAASGRVYVWDAGTGALLFASEKVDPADAEDPRLDINLLRFSTDGRRILARGGSGHLFLLDASTGKVIGSQTDPSDTPWFTGDGRGVGFLTRVGRDSALRAVAWDGQVTRTLWDATGMRGGLLAESPDGRLLATSENRDQGEPTIIVREAATGGVIRRWRGHRTFVTALTFSPDGRTLASASRDLSILLWDVRGQVPRGEPADGWERLAQDAGRSFDAVCRLATPEGAAFLARRLRPVLPIPPDRWAALLDRLDSDDFRTRERASQELPTLGPAALVLAQRSLDTEKRREVVRRLQAAIRSWPPEPELLREARALMALEWAKAIPLLKRLAAGADGVPLTEEARAALARMKR